MLEIDDEWNFLLFCSFFDFLFFFVPGKKEVVVLELSEGSDEVPRTGSGKKKRGSKVEKKRERVEEEPAKPEKEQESEISDSQVFVVESILDHKGNGVSEA
jgi:hypothetical protein